MPKFKFVRVVKYTETVEVEAADLASAKAEALQADGEHNNDDSVYELRLISQS